MVDGCGTAGLWRKGRTLDLGQGVPREFVVQSLKAERLREDARLGGPPPRVEERFGMDATWRRVRWGANGGMVFLVYEPDDVARVIEGLMEAI